MGEYNLLTSVAVINAQEAYQRAIDNRRLQIETRWELRREHESRRAEHQGPRRTAEERASWNQSRSPRRLTLVQFDGESGTIAWPGALMGDDFADLRVEVERLFASRQGNQGGIASGNYGLYQTKGRCTITTPSITTVAGDGVDILDGAIRASTTTAEKPNGLTTNNDFGVVITAATTSTSQDVYLYGDPITGQT